MKSSNKPFRKKIRTAWHAAACALMTMAAAKCAAPGNLAYKTTIAPRTQASVTAPVHDPFPIPGYRSVTGRELVAEPSSSLGTKVLLTMQINGTDFFKQRADIKSFMDKMHDDPALQEKIDDYKKAIGHIRQIKDPLTKYQAISCLSNSFAPYDHDKASAYDAPGPYRKDSWVTSIQEMFVGGKGNGMTCMDFSAFTAHTAEEAGEKASSPFIFGTREMANKPYFHAVAAIKTPSGTVIIPNDQPDADRASRMSLLQHISERTLTEMPSSYFAPDKRRALLCAMTLSEGGLIFKSDKSQIEGDFVSQSKADDKDVQNLKAAQLIAAKFFLRNKGASTETHGQAFPANAALQSTLNYFSGIEGVNDLVDIIAEKRASIERLRTTASKRATIHHKPGNG